MIIFARTIENFVERWVFRGQIVLIFGPRQSGKTTFSKNFIKKYGDEGAYFSCEHADVRAHFIVGEPDKLRKLTQGKRVVVFDEAQTIENIGTILKVYWDKYPDIQIIATGSSSFDLANKINEPMTGRAVECVLPPLSLGEITGVIPLTLDSFNDLLRFGSYPAIVSVPDEKDKATLLRSVTTNYLYKDVYMLESLRNPKLLEDLLRALAGQIGSTVSIKELADTVGADSKTVKRYMRLLEQAYVIFRLHSFSRNHRNELKKAFKVYFMDVGIRNAILGNLSPMDERDDYGAIFENFFIAERYKLRAVADIAVPSLYFWRTRQGMEIDLIEETAGKIHAFECKWQPQSVSFKTFIKKYPGADTAVVTPESVIEEHSGRLVKSSI